MRTNEGRIRVISKISQWRTDREGLIALGPLTPKQRLNFETTSKHPITPFHATTPYIYIVKEKQQVAIKVPKMFLYIYIYIKDCWRQFYIYKTETILFIYIYKIVSNNVPTTLCQPHFARFIDREPQRPCWWRCWW